MLTNEQWTIFLVGCLVGALVGGWIGSRWRDWVESGMEWLIAVCAAVGVLVIVIGGFAFANGWRP